MRFGVILMVACLIVAATAATASTVNLTASNLTANGWKATTTYVWGGSTNATVTETTHYSTPNFRFYTGTMPNSWEFQWAGISSNSFANMSLSCISSVKIRNFGLAGDNASNWQPATFTWVIDKGDGNQRCVTWQPWSNGNARAAGVWNEYDAAVSGTWHIYETGANYTSLAALKAALPNAFFVPTADLPLSWGYASQNAFNVGQCPLYDEDRAWFSGVTSYVDWFEVGLNGCVTRYDLGYVPEPGSLLALGTGLLGLLGIVRRRK